MAKIPVRYIGGHTVTLKDPTAVRDAQGNPLTTGLLQYGDTILMEEDEVLGYTLFNDTPGSGTLAYLGPGRVIKPEHAELSASALEVTGYVFNQGRADFEVLETATVVESTLAEPTVE